MLKKILDPVNQVWMDEKRGLKDENKRTRARQLRNLLTALGPTFVKVTLAAPLYDPMIYDEAQAEIVSVYAFLLFRGF